MMQPLARLPTEQFYLLHQFLHLQTADRLHLQQTSYSCNRPDHATALQSMSNNSTWSIISIPRPYQHTPLVNLGLNKLGPWSSSLCNIYFNLFNYLQIPDHAATPMICTEHQNYPDLLDSQSPRTISCQIFIFQLHQLSTLFRLHGQYTAAAILHPCKPFMYGSPNEVLAF